MCLRVQLTALSGSIKLNFEITVPNNTGGGHIHMLISFNATYLTKEISKDPMKSYNTPLESLFSPLFSYIYLLPNILQCTFGIV